MKKRYRPVPGEGVLSAFASGVFFYALLYLICSPCGQMISFSFWEAGAAADRIPAAAGGYTDIFSGIPAELPHRKSRTPVPVHDDIPVPQSERFLLHSAAAFVPRETGPFPDT